MSDMPKCETCKWAVRVKEFDRKLSCHRYPPHPTDDNDYWPIVAYIDFCGEHTPKEKDNG